ncbi:transposase [Streptomyces sioyaensis]|uniref:IS110 family transposase n=1 Tax=Streptomyces sioyaensis TaxID=67364 RepID=UPI0036E23D07
MTTLAQPDTEITGGVDTRKDTHTAAVIDSAGRELGWRQFPTTPIGYRVLLSWLRSFGTLVLVRIEGTGVYGAGLARMLATEGVETVEIDRPDRKSRRWQGKSDPVDAYAAARTALSRRRTGIPKQRDGQVEALGSLRMARRSAVQHRADLVRWIKALAITAPDQVRTALRYLSDKDLLTVCARFCPDPQRMGEPAVAAKAALHSMAHRHRDLTVTAGQNPKGLKSEAAFAMLRGVAPLPASFGRTHRHRLTDFSSLG